MKTNNSTQSTAAEMNLIGGRLCLDFANTVGGRRSGAASGKPDASTQVLSDKLNDYFDLVAWSRNAGILTEDEEQALLRESRRRRVEAAAVFERAVALREAIYRICKATLSGGQPKVADLETLNGELLQARSHERFARAADSFTWEWVDAKKAPDRMLWPVARSAAEFLIGADLSRLRECGGADCGWLFEDVSRNRSRQWCDMQDCGNRAKVRRFRTRMRKAKKGRYSS